MKLGLKVTSIRFNLNISHFYNFTTWITKTFILYPSSRDVKSKLGCDKNNLKLSRNLPSKIVDSQKCLQLNLIDVTFSPNFIYSYYD